MFISDIVWRELNATYTRRNSYNQSHKPNRSSPQVAFSTVYGRVSLRPVLTAANIGAGHCVCRTHSRRRRVLSLAGNYDERGSYYNLGRALRIANRVECASGRFAIPFLGLARNMVEALRDRFRQTIHRTTSRRGGDFLYSPFLTTQTTLQTMNVG